MPPTVTSLKKENKALLKAQIKDESLESLQEKLKKEYNYESCHLVRASSSKSLDPETTEFGFFRQQF